MEDRHVEIYIDTLRKLSHRKAVHNIRKIIDKLHQADMANILRHLEAEDKIYIFDLIDDAVLKAQILGETEEITTSELLEGMDAEKIVDILQHMPSDELTDIVGILPEEVAQQVLSYMQEITSSEVEELLKYDKETAGGIMTPRFLALSEDTSAEEAIIEVRKAYEAETVFYIYVVDQEGHFLGVLSLRELIIAPPNARLSRIMKTDVWKVHTDMDQEQVAQLVSKYNILAIPVVDDKNVLVGIITVDDVIDVIRREATEDILKMGGTQSEEYLSTSVFRRAKLRIPWLFATWMGGFLALQVVGHFEGLLERMVYLAAFMPIISGMGGNVGTQTSAIVVRGLATGRVNPREVLKVLGMELRTGLILGVCYGLLLGFVARAQFASIPMLGMTVGLAICAAMVMSSVIATIMPMIFQRLNVDPAIATGPSLTTTVDVLSILTYFTIASTLLF